MNGTTEPLMTGEMGEMQSIGGGEVNTVLYSRAHATASRKKIE